MNILVANNDAETIVSVVGRLDTITSPELDKELKPYVDGSKTLVLECSEMNYISSSGLRVVLAAHKLTTSAGGRFVIRNLNREVRSVFEITGLTSVLCLE